MGKNTKIILLILFLSLLAFLAFVFNKGKHENKPCIVIDENAEWLKSSRNLHITGNVIEVELLNQWNGWKYNKMEAHPMLDVNKLTNNNGALQYVLTKEELAGKQFYPKYNGPTIPKIDIKKCVMISVDIEKYNNTRNETLILLKEYKLPPLTVFFGYTPDTVRNSRFNKYIGKEASRGDLTAGMLEVFENFANESDGQNEWMLYFEDDVRVINLDKSTDLTKLYNVPIDAELIRPYIDSDEKRELQDLTYYVSYGGAATHAFYISTEGCRKVVNYAKKYGWRYPCDIEMYKTAKFCKNYPTNLDSFTFWHSDSINDISDKLQESEKIVTYHLSNAIFDQTSVPIGKHDA